MKICFECLGFRSNPVFLDRGEESPIPYGVVIDNGEKLEYWIENHMPNVASNEDVLAEYKKQLEEKGVVENDVSKKAWSEGRFAEPKKDQKTT